MESRIPIPTDNIFKFYALFGLLLFVFGVGASLYNTRSTNDFVANAAVEYAQLSALPTPTAGEQKRKEILLRLLGIASEDKKLFRWASALIAAFCFWIAVYGFWIWHRRIQPIQDAISRLQLRKLEIELQQLERSAVRESGP